MAARRPAPRPTLEAVAAVAGVSRATVSRVINGVPTVDPAIVAVVEQAIDETGYVPNLAARTLVTRRTGSVALVVSEPSEQRSPSPFLERLFTDPYIGRVTAGAQLVLRPRDIHLAILPADPPAHATLDHTSRDGRSPGARAHAQGYPNPGAENVAKGYRTAQDVVRGWMDSPGHRANILDCGLREIGVGHASGAWTQGFGWG